MANESNPTLFYHPSSYYSQRVLLCLHEKQLPFKPHVIELEAGETYSPWYMKLNPQGKVPLLKDGDKIVADSKDIVEYLEKTYGGKVMLPDILSDFGKRVKHFVQLLGGINVPVLNFGGMIFPEVVHESHLPSSFVNSCKKRVIENHFLTLIEAGLKQDPSMKEIYEEKMKTMAKYLSGMKDKDGVLLERNKTRDILHEIENQLRKTQEDNPGKETWLCGEDFTLADIDLCILLNRLYFIGYSGAMWENNLLPNVDGYFAKVKTRQSFKDVVAPVTSPS